ncbi:MAG: RNA polymerase sigma factor SigZ [Gammaproteobacteria bacterium]|nr:RNA polymerase sigma factor SigZ [Gammaproteobacteria bacterium]
MLTTENIWLEYHQKLSGFIKSRISDDAADDLLQDVFLKVHAQLDSLKTDTKVESWLYQITRNTVIDYYRANRRLEELPKWIEQPESDESTVIRQELSACLEPMISQLPDKYREAIQLSEIEGKTQKELSKKENISLSGAKSRVQRGRALLKSLLNDCCQIEINNNNQLVSYNRKSQDCDCG